MTPFLLYQADLAKPNFFADPAQSKAIDHLQRLYEQLQVQPLQGKKKTRLGCLVQKVLNKKEKKVRLTGLYFYGGVGRGKTYLMDLFFHSLLTKRKLRLHFHHFMLRVHQQLALLEGQINPLPQIAKLFAAEADVLCFDEFYVDDIADAMIIAGILSALFDQGVVLVATSNSHPEDLYRNGLQRARFLPAIELIKTNCEIVHLDGPSDYRLDRLSETEIYHYPLDNKVDAIIEKSFENLAQGSKVYGQEIVINQRRIKTIASSTDSLLIEFATLCGGPRSVADYIAIAVIYRTIFLVNIKQMNDAENDRARRFIVMIDEFYERHVVLIISAEVEIKQLYTGDKLNFEFKRCVSRLQEMQSEAYLQQIDHIDPHQFKS